MIGIANREIKIIIDETTAELLEKIKTNAINEMFDEGNMPRNADLKDNRLLELVLSIGIRELLENYSLVYDEEKQEWFYE